MPFSVRAIALCGMSAESRRDGCPRSALLVDILFHLTEQWLECLIQAETPDELLWGPF